MRYGPTGIVQLRHRRCILPCSATYPDSNADIAADGNTDSDTDTDTDPDTYTSAADIYSHEHADSDTHGNTDQCGRRIQRRHLGQVAYPLLSDGRGKRRDRSGSWFVAPKWHLSEWLYSQRYRHPSPDG